MVLEIKDLNQRTKKRNCEKTVDIDICQIKYTPIGEKSFRVRFVQTLDRKQIYILLNTYTYTYIKGNLKICVCISREIKKNLNEGIIS